MHVLIATDGSERSILAARRGRVLLRNAEKITLLSVITDGPVLTPDEQSAMWEQEVSEAEHELADTSAALPNVPVEKVVEVGDAAPAICQVAERLGVDVIVVGSHGRTGLARIFLGSVSEHVVRHAPCAVLVIPNRAQ
jgi:nucleotide-binding universal stress UspA family protein